MVSQSGICPVETSVLGQQPSLRAILFSTVFVICGQPWSEVIKWKIAEINNLYFLSYTPF